MEISLTNSNCYSMKYFVSTTREISMTFTCHSKITILKFPDSDRFSMIVGTQHMHLQYGKGELATCEEVKSKMR